MSVGVSAPRVVAQLVNCLGLGGTERQLVEHMRRLDRTRFTPVVFCLLKKGEFLTSLRELGLDPPEFHLKGTLLRPNTAVQVLRLAQALRSSGAELLHCHDFYSNVIGSAAATVAGIPFIVSRRDLGAWIGPRRARALSAITRLAPQVLCNAYAVKDHLVYTEGIDPERIEVVHNGLDLEQFDAAVSREPQPPLPALGEPAPVVVVVANMKHPVKGHRDFLAAAAEIARHRVPCRFLLVGDGDLRPGLERDARELGLADQTIFAGRRTDVPAILARSAIAVSSSHAEGLSNAIMEAMAARLPVVATSVGGNAELVQEGRNGFLVRRGDPGQLAARILDLLRAPQLGRRMGLAGRKRIEEEFSATLLGGRMAALYERLLGKTGGERRAA